MYEKKNVSNIHVLAIYTYRICAKYSIEPFLRYISCRAECENCGVKVCVDEIFPKANICHKGIGKMFVFIIHIKCFLFVGIFCSSSINKKITFPAESYFWIFFGIAINRKSNRKYLRLSSSLITCVYNKLVPFWLILHLTMEIKATKWPCIRIALYKMSVWGNVRPF